MQLDLAGNLIDFVYELEKQKFSKPYSKEQLLDMLNDPNYKVTIIDGKGYIITLKTDVIELIRIAVVDESIGWGSVILKNIEPGRVILEVNHNNTKAINFYKKHGFKQIDIRKNYYDDGDAIVMERK